MSTITNNEIKFILTIFKYPKTLFNANSIAKKLNLSSMGALKIGKKLEEEGILQTNQLGQAKFYTLNLTDSYTISYLRFLLKREAKTASPYIQRWINDLKKIREAKAIILFGSVLHKEKKANDIDALFLTTQKGFNKLKKQIEELNELNEKKIHPLYQTNKDFRINLRKKDKVLLNAIKGIIINGEKSIINLIANESIKR